MNIEKAKAISQSSNWEEVCKELSVWVDLQLQHTRTCSPDQLGKIQAKIEAYEEVKRLPQIIIDRSE